MKTFPLFVYLASTSVCESVRIWLLALKKSTERQTVHVWETGLKMFLESAAAPLGMCFNSIAMPFQAMWQVI